jgi:hypothetical protein
VEHTFYKCPVCNGLGVKDQQILEICSFCHGRDLNWIENIFGVKPTTKREAFDTMIGLHVIDDIGNDKIHLKVVKRRFKK